MQRLYVGGLSHSITQKDLKDRFGKFGDVEDVELRTRRDDEGVPYKTFGYININISDVDLKKCMTVLNKSKWKGGTLQIETAKESFLHRLAEERQAAAEQHLQQSAAEDKRQKMLDSLSKAGVHNFTMKAAVPGTEIPGHKDWVVSKFGRVLPVLQLSCRKGSRARTLKYDPSKYSHNIRRLNPSTADEPTPVTQLTWEVPGGDDDISKKRRGEFPPYQPSRPKKSRTDMVISHNAAGRIRFEKTESVNNTEAHQVTNGFELPTNHRPAQRRGAHVTDSDVDSDEEIRRLVAVQQTSHGALWQEVEEDNLEVVGLDYLVKSGLSRQQQKGMPDDKDEDDYDSADTDEFFASRKPPPQEKLTQLTAEDFSGNNTDRKRKMKKKSKAGEQEEEEEKYDSSDAEERLPSRKPSSAQQRQDSGSEKQGSSSENQSRKITVLPVVKPPSSESESDEEDDDESDRDDEDDEELESTDSDSDLDYEAMFSNVTRLEISLADLQKLAEASQETSNTTAPSILSAAPEQETNLTSDPAERPAPKKGTMPEEILAAIMEEDSSEDERKKKKKKKRKDVTATLLPAFQGTRALSKGSETDECQKRQKEEEEEGSVIKKQKLDSEAPQLNHRATDSKTSRTLSGQKHTETEKMTSESSEEDEEEEEEEEDKREELVKSMGAPKVLKTVPTKIPVNAEKAETGSSSSSDDEEEEDEDDDNDEEEEERIKANQSVLTAKAAAKASPSSSSSSSEEDEDEQEILPAEDAVKAAPPPAPHSESSSSEEDEDEEEKAQAPPRLVLGAKEEEERQRKDNMRRLAAVQQRQKEAEEHKKLIQGALANLDTPAAGAGKHIVFGSDDDDDDDDNDDGDDEDKQQTPSEVTTSKKTLFQDSQSEDEATDDEAAANENGLTKEKVRLKPSGPQLFGSSEDEEDGDEEEDDSRFDIRPQFEGRAGQKLMELQSRFGTDDRFRMDSRFLEEDDDKEEESERKASVTEEDEALEEERKKNLSILQSVLGISQQTCSSKTAGKAKTFRDVSALHYDPSREEHAAFETKTDETKKESKSARKKKREEAQKLPDVSKEIYYDVSGDLKAMFGLTKDDAAGGEEKTSWDQEEEVDEGGKDEEQIPLSSLLSAETSAEIEESSGFKFSFFGDNAETGSTETAEYKVESIQAAKVSWQQDPRLQDSSSEEEEEVQEEHEENINTVAKTTEEETTSKKELFFFFYPEDSRLTEGPRWFCRSSQLEEQREQWEERRSALRQEYRKKHKDARRKLKSSHRS